MSNDTTLSGGAGKDDDISLLEAAQDLLDARDRLGSAVMERYDLWRCLAAIVSEERS